MPYNAGSRLPGERASRLGHLDVLNSELVTKLVKNFQEDSASISTINPDWESVPEEGKPLSIIFGVDGSVHPIESETPPYKRLAFVKTALLRIDQFALSKIDKDIPHPLALRDILSNSALYHATVFPLRHVSIPGTNIYNTIRQIIFESIKDESLNGEPMETLKWIAYEKWNEKEKELDKFGCPHCGEVEAILPYNAETGKCPVCQGDLFLTDMLGFHLDMISDAAPDTIATTYMSIHEVLLLFTGIRYFWENNKEILSECLFVKDGPLTIRAQYSKLVNPIRRFLVFARDQGHPVYIIGQEKSGRFFEHLEVIGRKAPYGNLFIPQNNYIKKEIQQRPETGAPYGRDTNYGVKVFVKLSEYHQMVLSIPTGDHDFDNNLSISDLIGSNRIFATLPFILSNRFEGGLLPVELAHGIASLSTYPSAQILKIFSDENIC